MGVKLKSAALVGSLIIALTGSLISFEAWEDLNPEERVSLIQESQDLEPEQKNILLAMMTSDPNDQEMIDMFSRKAKELRIEASKESKISIRRKQLENAAKFFEKSIESIRTIRGMENMLEGGLVDMTDKSPKLVEAHKRATERLRARISQDREELKKTLVEAFIAVGSVERDKESNKQSETASVKNTNTEPKPTKSGMMGISMLVIGLIGSFIAAVKVLMELKKTKVELTLAKMKLEKTADIKPSS
jgi:hypothetical protein